MDPERLFSLSTNAAIPAWALLAATPRWRWTERLVHSGAWSLALCVLYAGLLGLHLAGSPGGFASLADVARLFSNPWLLLAGWVHYLAFDLFVGAWEVRDAQARGVPHLAVVPCLFATLMVGPAGLLLYFVVRTVAARVRRPS